jgi:hypothetical protein
VDLAQLIRFLVVELIYPGLNPRFNMGVAFTVIFFSVGGGVPVDIKAFLVNNFVNLKIKPAQSFKGVHMSRMYVCVHRDECSYVYKCLYL